MDLSEESGFGTVSLLLVSSYRCWGIVTSGASFTKSHGLLGLFSLVIRRMHFIDVEMNANWISFS